MNRYSRTAKKLARRKRRIEKRLQLSRDGRFVRMMSGASPVLSSTGMKYGGWSQATGMPSDAWATGQAIYALTHGGVRPGDSTLVRGADFLVKTQRADGAWPMTSRPTAPGGAGAGSLIPITGGAAAWGVQGLVRSAPPISPPAGPRQ